jgi:hypothetical protein
MMPVCFGVKRKVQNKSKTQWKSKITHLALACHKSKDDEICLYVAADLYNHVPVFWWF